METEGLRCDQLVTIDNCCTPTVCSEPASHTHEASGLSLCATHHGNAVKYALDGTWTVGNTALPFPEGWTPVGGASDASSVVVPASAPEDASAPEGVRPSGLVIETGTLSPSGLVIER
ncbi:MAG: hypothetical protein IT299_13070 [Dehalococcoidia bacterium]|nr:hypothetical protein [Dehalococcoidia bacterium]